MAVGVDNFCQYSKAAEAEATKDVNFKCALIKYQTLSAIHEHRLNSFLPNTYFKKKFHYTCQI